MAVELVSKWSLPREPGRSCRISVPAKEIGANPRISSADWAEQARVSPATLHAHSSALAQGSPGRQSDGQLDSETKLRCHEQTILLDDPDAFGAAEKLRDGIYLAGTIRRRDAKPPQPAHAAVRYPAAVTTDERSISADTGAAATSATPAGDHRARGLVVAIDGPASSGKSTVGAEAALELGFRFCDTGLLYRAVTWLAVERGVAPDQLGPLVALADEVELFADDQGRLCNVRVGDRDVTDEVHLPAVDRVVSDYAKVAELRTALVPRQREIAAAGAIIMAGRDIGTVILPDADLKIYLSASAEERARRRAMQRDLAPDGAEAVRILEDLQRRDAIDSGRATAPLRVAAGSLVIETDGIGFDDSVAAVTRAIRKAAAGLAAARAVGDRERALDGR